MRRLAACLLLLVVHKAALAAQPAASPAVTRSGAASTAGAAAPPAAKPAVPKPATKPAAAGAAGSPAGAKTPAAAAKSPGAGANAPAAAAPMGSEAPAAGSEAPAASGKAPAAGAKTIAGALKAAGFTDCLKLIEAAGGGKRANDPKTVATVFCPTNQAVDAFLKEMGLSSLDDVARRGDLVDKLAAYHIAPGVRASAARLEGAAADLAPAKGGSGGGGGAARGAYAVSGDPHYYLRFVRLPPAAGGGGGGGALGVLDAQGRTARVVRADVDAGASVVHGVDRVLLSGEYFPTLAAFAKFYAANFTELPRALNLSGGAALLQSNNWTGTLFAPVDAAFAAAAKRLPPAGAGAQRLEAVLAYHQLPAARHFPGGFDDGAPLATRLAGHKLAVKYRRYNITENGKAVAVAEGQAVPEAGSPSGPARVSLANVHVARGIVHGVDGVLLPALHLPAAGGAPTVPGAAKAPAAGAKPAAAKPAAAKPAAAKPAAAEPAAGGKPPAAKHAAAEPAAAKPAAAKAAPAKPAATKPVSPKPAAAAAPPAPHPAAAAPPPAGRRRLLRGVGGGGSFRAAGDYHPTGGGYAAGGGGRAADYRPPDAIRTPDPVRTPDPIRNPVNGNSYDPTINRGTTTNNVDTTTNYYGPRTGVGYTDAALAGAAYGAAAANANAADGADYEPPAPPPPALPASDYQDGGSTEPTDGVGPSPGVQSNDYQDTSSSGGGGGGGGGGQAPECINCCINCQYASLPPQQPPVPQPPAPPPTTPDNPYDSENGS